MDGGAVRDEHGAVRTAAGTDLLERDGQLAAILAHVEAAAGGEGRMLLLAGEAGVGKSALVEQACRANGTARVWAGSCERLFGARPLGPLIDIASAAGGTVDEVVARGARVHEILPVLLAELRDRPTVLVLEDVHWADEATLDLVALLGGRMASTSSLAIVTYRDDELAVDHALRQVLGGLATATAVHRMRLAALSPAAVTELAGPDRADVDELYRRTGGNPFFVTEVLADGDAPVPASVRDAVLARAARLDSGARALLDAVSVVPGWVSFPLLTALGGEHADRLDACMASGMLVAWRDGVGFRHDLARAAIDEAIDPLRKVGLHRVALDSLRSVGGDVARLAHHAEAAADAAAVEEHALAAADAAIRAGAHREAAAQFARVLRCCALAPDRQADVLERGGYECYVIDRFDEGIEWMLGAVHLRRAAGDTAAEGRALVKLSTMQRCAGLRDDAAASGRSAVALLGGPPADDELAAAYANLAMLALNTGEGDDGVRAAGRALELAEPRGQIDVVVHALNTIGTIRLLRGEEQGRASLERSLDLALAAGLEEQVGRAYLHFVDVAQRNRRWDLIGRAMGPGVEYCRVHGLDLWQRYLHIYHARTLLDRGRWTEAIDEIPRDMDRSSSPLPRIVALVVIGLVRARRGDPGQWAALDEAAELAERNGELQWTAPATAARAEALWLAGRASDMPVDELGTLMHACVATGSWWWAGELAWLRRLVGVDEAAPSGVAEPWALQLAGRAGDAASVWRRLGCPYEAGLALAASDAAHDLKRAHELLTALDAHPACAIVTRRLRAAGVRGVPRGARATTRSNPAGLTAREMDVARLLTAGLRNADIAERLVVSVKTVDHHVASVLTKLGVPSRAAAAREAVRLGIEDG